MRVVMIGGGSERGLALAESLIAEGHAVRIVSRDGSRREAIEAIGAECWPGTPDVVGTLRYALENVTVLCWLLGTATGSREELEPLFGSRLKMLLEKTTDTTVRGVVYETTGTVDPDLLASGAHEVRHAFTTNEIPYAWVDADPAQRDAWVAAAREAIDSLLGATRATPIR
jgi:NAD(P)-dependent dehydrogenase (short-subunit alcohol dehydrogenase family)